MKLKVYWVDLRGGYSTPVEFETDVVNEDTGEKVGFVKASRTPRARHISLFGGKYTADFKSPEECNAFARGVEAVLNHMTVIDEPQGTERA